jgi:putative glycosyltransferase (TIGR04348 family)
VRVLLLVPSAKSLRTGNRVTSARWKAILEGLGHRVAVASSLGRRRPDVLVALHARKSAASIARFARERPEAPLVVALTGTDLYRDLARSAAARRSVALADRLVVLQAEAVRALPASARRKAVVVHQSLRRPSGRARRPDPRSFDVAVLAHLRPVKDPLLAARAARRLPATSRVRVVHAGGALTGAWAARARAEERRTPRYRWLGEVPRARALALLARSRALVLTSRLEGGANAVSEAIVAGVPVLSTRIAGSTGLLGRDYPGLFPVGDAAALARLLRRVEEDPRFLARLRRACARRAPLFSPARERAAWRRLLAGLRRGGRNAARPR